MSPIEAWVEPDKHGGAYHVMMGNENIAEILATYASYDVANHHANQILDAMHRPHFRDAQKTVGEIKKLLEDVPDEFLVETEGCDCNGPCGGISVDKKRNIVYMTRGRE